MDTNPCADIPPEPLGPRGNVHMPECPVNNTGGEFYNICMCERDLIYAEIVKFYEYWRDEMSADAADWMDDVLNMLKRPQHYGYLYEETDD